MLVQLDQEFNHKRFANCSCNNSQRIVDIYKMYQKEKRMQIPLKYSNLIYCCEYVLPMTGASVNRFAARAAAQITSQKKISIAKHTNTPPPKKSFKK